MWNYVWLTLLLPILREFFIEIQKILYNFCYKNITIQEGSQIYKCMHFYIAKNCVTFNGLVVTDSVLEYMNYLPHRRLGIVSIASGKYYMKLKLSEI